MKILRTKKEIDSFLSRLRQRAKGASPEIVKKTSQILDSIRKRGDRALLEFTKRFDGHSPKSLLINPKKIREIASKADQKVVSALRLSAERIKRFHERQRESSWKIKERGIVLGQIIRPLERVGVYVPGGKASYPSSVLMNVIPAQVAGVKEIAIAVPTPKGEVNPALMAAIKITGVEEVYCIGGAQAIGAFAYGTESIKRVDKIVGPGNIYVATAKKMVFGEVDIDMVAGPSEILIIADETAEPRFIAADMLSQAEHDELASSVLITDSEEVARAVLAEIEGQLSFLKRSPIAEASLNAYGSIILVKKISEALEIANSIAPEHLEVMTENPDDLLEGLRHAGAIFLGHYSPEPLGDYSAGPNHTLPTGGTARFSSPLGVYDFIKRTSLIRFTKEGFKSLASQVQTIADAEGLDAHANSIRIRL